MHSFNRLEQADRLTLPSPTANSCACYFAECTHTVDWLPHTKISESLKNINYSKFLSIEMRRVVGDEENSIKRSIKFISMFKISYI